MGGRTSYHIGNMAHAGSSMVSSTSGVRGSEFRSDDADADCDDDDDDDDTDGSIHCKGEELRKTREGT